MLPLTSMNDAPAELAKAYDPSSIEQKWASYWVEQHLFDVPADSASGEPFTVLLPPPNVTGMLHMGHMFEHAESDILVRWHRMRGDRALWIPGTDHAGIATQMLVERALKAEGVSRAELGREAFTARVWDWKAKYGSAIKDQMKRLGASVDWSREYFTMDDRLSKAVVEAFVRLHEQGLIYRGAYIVNWDPILQTAVSDLEVESEERQGKLYHIRYPLADGASGEHDSITIATTRPETMLGDVAVAVNPGDERYRRLIGKRLALPLTGREIPIVADDWANPEFGTGAVKVTPAHDPNDFAIGQRHNLPSLSILDKTARVDLPGSPFHGLDRYDAREQIVAELDALGLLIAVREHAMTVPVSQRSGAVIEPRLSEQWFLAVNKTPAAGGNSIAANALEAVRSGAIKITPGMYAKTYNEWMTNIHDWCLSRQLWWGHRIPAWHCADCRHIEVARTAPAACPQCSGTQLTQDPDVLDTWFSSGLLPFTVFGWPGVQDPGFTAQGAAATGSLSSEFSFYPTDLLVTGFDILFFWVARMIMLGTHFMLDVPNADGAARTLAQAVPFKTVYIHGLIRDAGGQKMSKTKGNVIDPIDIINRFGTDAVRFTLASQASPGADIPLNEARTEGYRAFANKIWNSARFLFMNIDRAPNSSLWLGPIGWPATAVEFPTFQLHPETPLESRWIVSRLAATCKTVDQSLRDYRFDEAANTIYQFFWGELCDWYIELIKLRLTFDEGENIPGLVTLGTFINVFGAALRLLSPFMPFITEELWQALNEKLDQDGLHSIALTRYPQAADYPSDPAAEHDMTLLQDLIVTIRGLRKELQVPEKEATPIRIFSPDLTAATLATVHADMLARMARVASVEVSSTTLTGQGSRSTPSFDVEVVYERQIDIHAERERLVKDLARYEKGLAAAERQLSNEAFTAKAPVHIIEGLRKQSTETRLLYEKTMAALKALPSA